MANDQEDNILEKDRVDFYKDAAQYWSNVPPTVDGMLGGFGHISTVDILGSTQFLKQMFRLQVPPGKGRALDCGAGIGRITKKLLFNHFQKVDLVEQNPAFVAQARAALETHKKMGQFFCAGLQEFSPEPGIYDVIWCQWVLGHLTDDDLISFLRGCICGLKKNGVIILKENTTTTLKSDMDPQDSSMTRPLHLLCELLQKAGLRCVKQKRQVNFPHGLYPVYMIATRPSYEKTVNNYQLCKTADTSANVETFVEKNDPRADSGTVRLEPSAGISQAALMSSTLQHSPLFADLTKNSLINSGLTLQEEQHVVTQLIASHNTSVKIVSPPENGGELEVFEQEAQDFDHQVEYSSDDSTKTDENSEVATTSLCGDSENPASNSPLQCDIA